MAAATRDRFTLREAAAALRRLADAIDTGRASLIELDVRSDVDFVDVPCEPHEHQRYDVTPRGQRIRISAVSMSNLFEFEGLFEGLFEFEG